MSPYLRRVKTASGATAVRVVAEEHGVRRIVEHPGSAHDEAGPAALMEAGRRRIAAEQGQGLLDLESLGPAPGRTSLNGVVVESGRSGLLWDVLHGACARLGPGGAAGGDRAFEQMVVARLIEPTSKADTPGALSEIGWPDPAHRNTPQAALARAQQRGYREAISQALFEHATATGGLALRLQA